MCYNATVSIYTYTIGIIGSLKLLMDGYIPEALFLMTAIQMQLIEYFLWNNINSNGSFEDNQKITKIGALIVHMEPIILWIVILLFSSRLLPTFINYFMFIFVILSILYIKGIYEDKLLYTTFNPEKSPHLEWKWNGGRYSNQFYLLFLLSFILLSIYGIDNGIFLAGLSLISFFISYWIYNDKHVLGSMWCFSAAFAPWILSLIYSYIN